MKIIGMQMKRCLNAVKVFANKALVSVPLISDTILAVANLTKSVNELIKAYTQLAKMVIEDREAINDLYQHVDSLQQERIDAIFVKETQKAQVQQTRQNDLSAIDVSWSKGDKKKMVN